MLFKNGDLTVSKIKMEIKVE